MNDRWQGDSESLELEPPVPHLIVPTIAGAGGEVSTQALVLDEDADTKRSLVATPILPEVSRSCVCVRRYLAFALNSPLSLWLGSDRGPHAGA